MDDQPTSDLREQLAAYAHEAWAGWMAYLFSRCEPSDSGQIPPWAVARWTRQANTLYANLTEEEKELDRAEADKMLVLVNAALTDENPMTESSAAFIAAARGKPYNA